MWSKKFRFVFYLLILLLVRSYGQDCTIKISGQVYDEVSQAPLSYVNVLIQENANGTITDEEGNFILDGVCHGDYHLIFSHIGCEADKIHLHIHQDTFLNIRLSHTPTSLSTVVIQGKKESLINQPTLSVNRQYIEDNNNQNLAGLIEKEAGVHLIKNGNSISKPVVHGLYGNRLTILNNGIPQSGQQWGNDHSPEIDPFAADKIILLKGASAIEYGGGNLGSVLLVEPKPIEREYHLHGQVNYTYDTNGRGHTLNSRLGKYSDALAWKINGTLKRYGDQKTPNYFLNNTGSQESNLALQLEKSWKEKIFYKFYASTFNTRLGILRGSHIGNLTDLEQALIADIPYFTEPDFSYDIEAPKQHVSHHFVKNELKYFFNDDQILELVMAVQNNDRKEFDIRRSGRSDIPALSLSQWTFNSDLKYTHNFANAWNLKIGNQNIITDNTNSPETGILPLIPDYITWKSGIFSTVSKKINKAQFNIGIRYDYEYQNVVTFSKTVPREILRFENNFHSVSSLIAAKYDISKSQSLTWNIGYSTRNPAINELYSSGLHQGVSGIEEGDTNLMIEQALKNTVEYKWLPNANFSISSLFYIQQFNNYIFLNPQDEFRLTIRGAFPVFRYEQTDAQIYGVDIASQFTLSSSFFGTVRYSYIRGKDTQNDIPLVFIPPNSFYGSLVYRVKSPFRVFKNIKISESEIEVNHRLVFAQGNLLADQDFISPPDSYNLIGLKISTNVITPKHKIRCFIKVENLLNSTYRDYLNRQRYFADDIGISISTGVGFKF